MSNQELRKVYEIKKHKTLIVIDSSIDISEKTANEIKEEIAPRLEKYNKDFKVYFVNNKQLFVDTLLSVEHDLDPFIARLTTAYLASRYNKIINDEVRKRTAIIERRLLDTGKELPDVVLKVLYNKKETKTLVYDFNKEAYDELNKCFKDRFNPYNPMITFSDDIIEKFHELARKEGVMK